MACGLPKWSLNLSSSALPFCRTGGFPPSRSGSRTVRSRDHVRPETAPAVAEAPDGRVGAVEQPGDLARRHRVGVPYDDAGSVELRQVVLQESYIHYHP